MNSGSKIAGMASRGRTVRISLGSKSASPSGSVVGSAAAAVGAALAGAFVLSETVPPLVAGGPPTVSKRVVVSPNCLRFIASSSRQCGHGVLVPTLAVY